MEQLFLRLEGTDNQWTPINTHQPNTHEPTTYVNGPGGSEGNANPSFTTTLPDYEYLDRVNG
jgi:hypothetical protein